MSKLNRRKSRKLLFQKLYCMCFNQIEEDRFSESFVDWIYEDNIDENYLKDMIDLIKNNEYKLLYVIEKYSPRFDIKNMNINYLLPILIWACEMFFLKEEIPAKVSINEAVEISKIYWDESSKNIVNWVLNKIYKDYDKLSVDFKNISKKSDFSLFVLGNVKK